jgi:hypothetical protein
MSCSGAFQQRNTQNSYLKTAGVPLWRNEQRRRPVPAGCQCKSGERLPTCSVAGARARLKSGRSRLETCRVDQMNCKLHIVNCTLSERQFTMCNLQCIRS